MSPYSTKEIWLCLNFAHSEKNRVTLQTFELDLSQTSCSPPNTSSRLPGGHGGIIPSCGITPFLWLGGGRCWPTCMPGQDTEIFRQ